MILDCVSVARLWRPPSALRSGISSSLDGLAKGFSDITIIGDPSASCAKLTVDCIPNYIIIILSFELCTESPRARA